MAIHEKWGRFGFLQVMCNSPLRVDQGLQIPAPCLPMYSREIFQRVAGGSALPAVAIKAQSPTCSALLLQTVNVRSWQWAALTSHAEEPSPTPHVHKANIRTSTDQRV